MAKRKAKQSKEPSNQTKHKFKDNIFIHLFRDKNNVLRLYQDLNPDKTDVTVDQIEINTLDNLFLNSMYNDLGFCVGDTVVVLVEAQSKWNPNITLRLLIYLLETYVKILEKTQQSLHSSTLVKLPLPELYVVYTGKQKVPSTLSLNRDMFGGKASVDAKVKVLKQVSKKTIYGQYIGFCHVSDQMREKYGKTPKSAQETVNECIRRGYLTDYLTQHKQEVITMLSKLFDEEYQREQYNIALARQAREEGIVYGREESREETALNLLALGSLSIEDIAKVTQLSVEKVMALSLSKAVTTH